MDNSLDRLVERLVELHDRLGRQAIDCSVGLAAIEVAIETAQEEKRDYPNRLSGAIIALNEAVKAFRTAEPAAEAEAIIVEIQQIITGSFIRTVN